MVDLLKHVKKMVFTDGVSMVIIIVFLYHLQNALRIMAMMLQEVCGLVPLILWITR